MGFIRTILLERCKEIKCLPRKLAVLDRVGRGTREVFECLVDHFDCSVYILVTYTEPKAEANGRISIVSR